MCSLNQGVVYGNFTPEIDLDFENLALLFIMMKFLVQS